MLLLAFNEMIKLPTGEHKLYALILYGKKNLLQPARRQGLHAGMADLVRLVVVAWEIPVPTWWDADSIIPHVST